MTRDQESEIIRRELDTSEEEPATQIAMAVADIEDKEVDELESLYQTVDHVVDHIFSDPPKPGAQVEVAFSYEGYRITIDQEGVVTFVKVG
jgi:hypothetical protein